MSNRYLLYFFIFALTAAFSTFIIFRQSDPKELGADSSRVLRLRKAPNHDALEVANDKHRSVIQPDDHSTIAKEISLSDTIKKLQHDLMIPVDEISDNKTGIKQVHAIGQLCAMQTPEAIEAIMKIFNDPEKYFKTIRKTNGAIYYSQSYFVMEYLNDVVEGIPQPLNDLFYVDEDIPRFKEWWSKNRGAVRFKLPAITPANR
jgi:hypothetical protein